MLVNRMVFGVSLLAIGLLLVSCGSKAPSPAAPAAVPVPLLPPASSLTDASALYVANCALCHGDKRQGRYGSGGVLTPESLAERSDTVVRTVLSEGIPYTAMPAWKNRLSPEEIDALVQFIKYTSP